MNLGVWPLCNWKAAKTCYLRFEIWDWLHIKTRQILSLSPRISIRLSNITDNLSLSYSLLPSLTPRELSDKVIATIKVFNLIGKNLGPCRVCTKVALSIYCPKFSDSADRCVQILSGSTQPKPGFRLAGRANFAGNSIGVFSQVAECQSIIDYRL